MPHAPPRKAVPKSDIEIVYSNVDLAEGIREAIGAVAEERRFIFLVSAIPKEEAKPYSDLRAEGRGVQFAALQAGRVVGWCDVVRRTREGTRHAAELGMGLRREVRGCGLGRRLLERTLDEAKFLGILRVELEVFSSNTNAIRLYERSGFEHEGVKRRARLIDEIEDDVVLMAKFL
jgi:RimJ/RimL family protein N-acetyltransferase